MNRISKNSKKRILANQIDARLGAFEYKRHDVVDPNHRREETDQQKEIRFKKLRDARKEETLNREKWHYWWDCHRDEMHCYYFPADYPTQEEEDWYRSLLERYYKGEEVKLVYDSTHDAIMRWCVDDIDRKRDYERFGHVHGPLISTMIKSTIRSGTKKTCSPRTKTGLNRALHQHIFQLIEKTTRTNQKMIMSLLDCRV